MDIICDYLINEKGIKENIASKMSSNLGKHQDISQELKYWIKNRKYISNSPLVVEGYTAMDIYKLAPFLDGIGVFNFLITLRDKPIAAKKYIDDGFPRK